jgi:C4-dicarboxylate-specific signal transduction histidine kinase
MGEICTDRSNSEIFLGELAESGRASALEEMASGVAHELNQPLAAITTFAQAGERMLNRPEPLVTRALEVFQQISHEALGGGARLRSIRRLFQSENAARTWCEIPDLLTEMQAVLERLASRSGTKLQIDIQRGLPGVWIDRLKIANVVLSLVRNALDASASLAGDRVIRIDAAADRYCVELGVVDFGAGIPDQAKERMFQPFFTTKPGGAGLDLSSSRAIIESHEGTIGFHNLPASGVRFWIRLPLAQN